MTIVLPCCDNTAITRRYVDTLIDQAKERVALGLALRETLQGGYKASDLRADLFAGLIVALVAMPLAMALGIASGVKPEQGIFTVVVGGLVVALLGGSRYQVTGPTAAFVVVLVPIAHSFGLSGLLIAGLMAGVILFAMGIARLGKYIQFIPYPVVTGFTAGIGLVIATIQLKDFLGLRFESTPETYVDRLQLLALNLSSFSWPDLVVGLFTLFILLFWARLKTPIPAPLVALVAAAVGSAIISQYFPEFAVATILERFGQLDFSMTLDWPWNFGDASQSITFSTIRTLVPSAFAIAILGGIESLLSATIADGMTQTKHNPDSELMALGIGNMLCPFFGGIAATGAIARTATNIRYGGRSPIAAMSHALFTLAGILVFSRWIGYLPMAALAALLLLVAYNISEVRHFFHVTRVAPRSDVLVLWSCFLLTVFFDMVVGVTAGVLLAALLFMKHMAAMTSSQVFQGQEHPHLDIHVPHDVLVYEITGPMFFGAAENAVGALRGIGDNVRAVIFVLNDVQ